MSDRGAERNLNQVAGDVHFLTAPVRFLWHSLLIGIFVILAPAIFLTADVLVLMFGGPDAVVALKTLICIAGPFATALWFMVLKLLPRINRGDTHHLRAFGAMIFAFVVSAAGALFGWVLTTSTHVSDSSNAAVWKSFLQLVAVNVAVFGPIIALFVVRTIRAVGRPVHPTASRFWWVFYIICGYMREADGVQDEEIAEELALRAMENPAEKAYWRHYEGCRACRNIEPCAAGDALRDAIELGSE